MKKLIGSFLVSPEFQRSLLALPVRAMVRATDGFMKYSTAFKMDMQIVERPHYSYCMLKAAELAVRLGHDRISAIEFGVAGGNGLVYMCAFAEEVKKMTGVTVDCYGFDTGEGMPDPEGEADLPYWFAAAQYRMDVPALKARVPQAKLVLGNIRDSIDGFIEEYNPAPIGAIFNDTDYWSSTRESFRLYDKIKSHPDAFLPRQFMYFDDVLGSETEMYGPHNGQILAINEFNAQQDAVKIHRNQNLLSFDHLAYRFQIYYAHLFEHPAYNTYVGGERQEHLQDLLKLKAAG
ncbi:hypothetical protein [uncultured Tateyamaria sp.]|uniref:hypothetical protein n=1 Tax=uncultured Tateyamaria sp. TaxID=455651 RepID=UPI00261ECA9E|nr:hypothetical protein [uncultured Tateyamaria sp.]